MKAIPLATLGAALVLAACVNQPLQAEVPAALVPAGERAVEIIGAKGVQIYQCRIAADGSAAWAFVGPEADLFDGSGRSAGKHYAGPHWEAADGSKVIGTVKSRADAPQAGAIPWLLLTTKSVGGDGRYAKVTSIQRINTVGGIAPAAKCEAAISGKTERVPYTADYVMLSPAPRSALMLRDGPLSLVP